MFVRPQTCGRRRKNCRGFRSLRRPQFLVFLDRLIGVVFRLRKKPGIHVARRLSVAAVSRPEFVLVDSQAGHLGLKGLPWNSEQRGGTGWPRYPATSFRQSGLDHPPCFRHLPSLRFVQATHSRTAHFRRGIDLEPRFVDGKRVVVAQDHSALDHILKFANVARPRVVPQEFERLLIYGVKGFPNFVRTPTYEVLRQKRNIIAAFPKRWHLDGKDLQSVEEIPPECARLGSTP